VLAGALTGTLFGISAHSAWAQDKLHRSLHTVTGHQVVLRPDAPTLAKVSSARSLYVLHCAGCHGLDGQGTYSAKVPDLRRMGQFLGLQDGRGFLLRVPGVMGSGLDDAQVAAVLNWLLDGMARQSRPPDQPPFAVAEVSQARRTPLADVMAERRRLETLLWEPSGADAGSDAGAHAGALAGAQTGTHTGPVSGRLPPGAAPSNQR
jgi:mono/diheme cytochrome c family protein